MITPEIKEKFADIIRSKLEARFKDEFVFDPIWVQEGLDLDGVPFLHAYIVYEGDQKKLDPSWRVSLPLMLRPYAEALGFPGIPLHAFVEKSEWPQLEKKVSAWNQMIMSGWQSS